MTTEPGDPAAHPTQARPPTSPGRPAFGIFVSYRRDDSSGHAGRLNDRLVERFGARRVFMDVNTIRPGMDFRTAIDQALAASSVVLAIIGTRWVDAANPDGTRRLEDADDLVRLELASALRRGMDVIPVLVQRASLPSADRLPEDLLALRARHAIEIDDARWDQDVTRLMHAIGQSGSAPPGRRRRRALGLMALIAIPLLVLAVGLLVRLLDSTATDTPAVSGDPSPSGSISSSPASSPAHSGSTPDATPSIGSILSFDELTGPTVGISASSSRYCDVSVADGLEIAAKQPFYLCDVNTSAVDPDVASIQDVHAEVDVTFARFSDTAAEFGPGAAQIACRRIGTTSSGNFYLVSFSPIGYWELSRFVDGPGPTVDAGIVPELATMPGETRHLGLLCAGPPGGPTTVEFSVDGQTLFRFLDPSGLDQGSVALGVTAFEEPEFGASFRNLEIWKP